METILIQPVLLEQVRNKTKTTTCRNGIRNYPLGKTILKSNSSEDYLIIEIKDLKYYKFSEITDKIAMDDGFENKDNLKRVMMSIYENITEESVITIVSFQLSED